jgi:hypothetical protein
MSLMPTMNNAGLTETTRGLGLGPGTATATMKATSRVYSGEMLDLQWLDSFDKHFTHHCKKLMQCN